MKFPITGWTGQVKIKGALPRAVCPVCLKQGKMALVETSLALRIYHLPLVALRRQIVAVCSTCGAQLEPTKKVLRRARRSPGSLIWPDELHRLSGKTPLFKL